MKKSTFLVFLSCVCFATGGLFFKVAGWDALAINGARSLIAMIMLLVFLAAKKHRFVINRDVIIAGLSISCTNILFSLGNKLTTAGNTIVLQFSMPVFVIIIMALCFKKKPSGLDCITCFFVLGGIICFFIDSLSAGNMLGNALSLLSGITYACYFIFNSRDDSDPFTAIILCYVINTLVGLPSLFRTDIARTPPKELLCVLALGIIQQGLAQMFFSSGIKDTPPVTAALVSGFEPVLNPVLVAVFYHEYLTPLSIAGAVIVLVSIVAYNVLRARQPAGKAEQ